MLESNGKPDSSRLDVVRFAEQVDIGCEILERDKRARARAEVIRKELEAAADVPPPTADEIAALPKHIRRVYERQTKGGS
jgi:hypothetical protein